MTGQSNLVVPAIGSSATASTIKVPAALGNGQEIADVEVNVEFDGLSMTQSIRADPTGPNGVVVTLANDELRAPAFRRRGVDT